MEAYTRFVQKIKLEVMLEPTIAQQDAELGNWSAFYLISEALI